jgi:hypothetical protein
MVNSETFWKIDCFVPVVVSQAATPACILVYPIGKIMHIACLKSYLIPYIT